jgi:hypothetical protein
MNFGILFALSLAFDSFASGKQMQTYQCTCGNRLFFDNTACLVCSSEVGWCEPCGRVTALKPLAAAEGAPLTYQCGYSDCQQLLRKCHNYAVENVCNRCTAAPPEAAPAVDVANAVPLNPLCIACRSTETIPDLSIAGNREKWVRLEAAKRRLLYTLDCLGLPYENATPKLSFDFKANVEHPADEWRNMGPAEIVYTGHADGKITINIQEADDAAREHLRVQFHEAHRTLVGHFHHEVGHYYWDVLVKGRNEPAFIKLFGDHNNPPYADAMSAYYQNGPREGWNLSFISPYASGHPWEDFAETFALYLDLVSVLDTASHLFKAMRVNLRSRTVTTLVERYQEMGLLVNEFNRTVGLLDLVPEVIIAPVVEKLEYIHSLVKRAAKLPRVKEAPIPPLISQPVTV